MSKHTSSHISNAIIERNETVNRINSPILLEVILPKRVISNAEAVALYANTLDTSNMRKSFLTALQRLQHLKPNLSEESDKTEMVFEIENVFEKDALCRIMAIEQLPIDWQYSKDEKEVIKSRISKAWELIRYVYPEIYLSIQTIIGSLLMAKLSTYEGGSVSSVIGAIWVSLDPLRPYEDFAEHIVHEYVHNCLFLEDMVHGIFVDGEQRLGENDAIVKSAILKIPRGYDKSFHSAFVSAVLAEMNLRLDRFDRHNFFLESLPTTIEGLLTKQQFLTSYGRMILAELVSWIEEHKGVTKG